MRFRLLVGAMISCVGCAAAIGWMLALPQHAGSFEGMFVVTPLIQFVKVALLVLGIFTLLIFVTRTSLRTPGNISD